MIMETLRKLFGGDRITEESHPQSNNLPLITMCAGDVEARVVGEVVAVTKTVRGALRLPVLRLRATLSALSFTDDKV